MLDTCPSCREKAVVSQLRVSRDLVDIVQYFKEARPGILAVIDAGSTEDGVDDDNDDNDDDYDDADAHSSLTTKKKTLTRGCAGRGTTASARTEKNITVQRIPQRVFHIEPKEKVKRALEKLTENCTAGNKIRTDGDKETLVKRYSEFVHLNNAQVGW